MLVKLDRSNIISVDSSQLTSKQLKRILKEKSETLPNVSKTARRSIVESDLVAVQTTLSSNKVEISVKPLRPYQEDALQEFLKRRKGVIMHATALGKTITAMEAIKQLNKPTAIVVPTIAILETVWLHRLKESGWSDVGCFYGVKKRVCSITVFTYQSAIRYPEKLKDFPFLVFDEAHHLRAPKYATLLPYALKAEYSLGLTATIDSRDAKNGPVLRVMPIIHRMPIGEARKEGWVSEIEVYSEIAVMTSAERIEYVGFSELVGKVTLRLGTPDPTVWSQLAKRGNVTARKGLWALGKRRMLLSNVADKVNVLLRIMQKHPEARTLVFSESISSIERAKNHLLANGVKCNVYHSKQRKPIKSQVLKAWRKGVFNCLLSCTALEEGIDVPQCSVGILYASGRTPRKIVQRLGRIIRPQEGKIAKIYVIYVPGTVESGIISAVSRAVLKVK